MQEVKLGPGLSRYFVDEYGTVYWQYQSNFREMTSRLNTNGYPYILIQGHKKLVHRVVAMAYLPNPEGKKCVNHKDGDKLNNALSNLEWVTHSENMKHAFKTGLWKPHNSKDRVTV